MTTTLPYRPEIDGLRAVAILSVLLYHAEFTMHGRNLISGGFLGVDIFFVISGYLITSLILKGLHEGSFTYRDFYERRARRILPVLFAVMLASLPFAWFFLLPPAMAGYAKSLIASIFFASNVWFLSAHSYWAADRSLEPFLHTWSLSVEEQFYVVMPLLLVFLYRLSYKVMVAVLLVLAIASLAFAEWASAHAAAMSFYLLPSRIWELLAGVLLAALERKCGRHPRALWTKTLPPTGIALIVISVFCFSEHTRHPSFWTLIPVVGTMLVIWFAHQNECITKILSSKPLVSLGLISYGLYIWHFPVFAFGQILGGDLSNADRAWLCVVSIMLSVVTFIFIEKPVRQRGKWPFRHIVYALILGLSVLLVFAIPGSTTGFESRFSNLLRVPLEPEKIENHQWIASPKPIGQRIIVAGDSHMETLAPVLRDRFLREGFDVAVSNVSDCELMIGANRVSKQNFDPHPCTETLQQERLAFITRAKPSFIILGGRLPLAVEEERFDNQEGGREGYLTYFIQDSTNSLNTHEKRIAFIQSAYQETVRRILQAGHHVILVYPVPEVGWHVPQKFLKNLRADYFSAEQIAVERPITTNYDVFRQRMKRSYAVLDSIQGDRIIRVYPEKLFCNTSIPGRCMTHDSEHLYYRDDNHLSDYGAELLTGMIIREIESVLQDRRQH